MSRANPPFPIKFRIGKSRGAIMMKTQKQLTTPIACLCLISQMAAQDLQQFVEKPRAPIFWRPYLGASVAPPRLKNSNRIYDLIRGGKLYLTVQDAIAVAIENNLDLEVDRLGPVNAEWNLNRARAGGALPGVTGGNTVANQAASGQGVTGSQAAAGLSTGNGGGGGSSTNAVVSQIGPITPNLDPVVQSVITFAHNTTPQPNTVQSQTNALIEVRHNYSNLYQQGLLTGGTVQVAANESYLKENAPTDFLNPSVAPIAQIFIRHNFLQGFGIAVNSRFIRVAEKQIGAARESFRSQLLNLIASVLNLYWDLVSYDEELKVRQRALDAAQKFLDDTKKQIGLGVIAKVELFRAEAELSQRRQELDIAQATVRQQELQLKSALSRNGLEDPLIDAAGIVPLDNIQVPANDTLPGLRELLARALAKRPDVVLAKIGDETAEISALGTANGVLPLLQGIASYTNRGLAGVSLTDSQGHTADPYFVGGLGTALGQVFRDNFITRREQITFQARIGNRISQADYGIEQLQLRQSDLVERRNMNDIVVSISNQMTALRQTQARYRAAVDARNLQEQLLEKEQQMFSFGTATITDVVNSRKSLLGAQLTEVSALSSYSHAKIALDQTLGETLEVNHVSIDEAVIGHVDRPSKVPDRK
jgi:outer membrane protein